MKRHDGEAARGGWAAMRHVVQFYDDEEFLCRSVAEFLGEGLQVGDPLLVFTTEHRLARIRDRLVRGGIDVQRAIDDGGLALLDAREMLGQLIVDGWPQWDRMRTTIGDVLDRSLAGRPQARARVFAEMVDLLCRDRNPDAAIRLEELWNELGGLYPLTLLCPYGMESFAEGERTDAFARVCRNHTHVLPTESFTHIDDPDDRLREISVLQQRARALENELEHRKKLEKTLREALEQRNEAEAERRLTQEELADFFENAVDPMHRVGPDGRIQWANRAELELLGYERDEYVGRSFAELHVDPQTGKDMMRRLSAGETLREYEAVLRAKDGSIRHVRIDSNALFRGGELVHTRCVTRDVTERRKFEDAMREAARTRAELLHRAQAASRAKDEFLAMLGHELRNPLSPILSALELMWLRLGDQAAKELGIIERQVQHLVHLVDDLLDVSRITRGKVDLRRQPVEIARIVARAVELAQPALTQRRHELVTRVPDEGLLVDGDEDRLTQVVTNLLTNAAKYTEPGGTVQVTGTREDGQAVIRVKDNGVGIAPQLICHLFETFVQGERSLARDEGGLGLGLAIVNNLVQLHGGTVSAHSDGKGTGSEFTVRLPLVAKPLEHYDRPRLPTPYPRSDDRARRILIVDDNTDAAELLSELLNAMGHQTRVAFDGTTALDAAIAFVPDVALLDIGLPVMDGYTLAGRIHEIAELQQTKLVAITGYGQRSDRDRSRRAGFHEHLVKPVDAHQLERALNRLFAA